MNKIMLRWRKRRISPLYPLSPCKLLLGEY
jgi:hypothetical protein